MLYGVGASFLRGDRADREVRPAGLGLGLGLGLGSGLPGRLRLLLGLSTTTRSMIMDSPRNRGVSLTWRSIAAADIV